MEFEFFGPKLQSERPRVAFVRYKLALLLGHSSFSGYVTISFELHESPPIEKLFLDFGGDFVHRVTINGHRVEGNPYSPWRISLNPTLLQKGANEVTVSYTSHYSTGANGLLRFAEEESGDCYIYSQCEQCYFPTIVPGFEQPDIRAEFIVSLIVPDRWTAVANGSLMSEGPIAVADIAKDFHLPIPPSITDWKLVAFKHAHNIPSYLFFVSAGDYRPFHSFAHGEIPIVLYCRRSLMEASDADKEELEEIILESLRFLEKISSTPFPYPKLDVVFAPCHKGLAMENIGAVLMDDGRFIFPKPASRSARLYRAYILVHELVHMWFGDLVTIKWWNHAWTKEGMATFLGYRILTLAPLSARFGDIGLRPIFNKADTLDEDAHPEKRHALECSVPKTTDADRIFDEQTYFKGCFVYGQFFAQFGEQQFARFLHTVCSKRANGCVTTDDIIQFLTESLVSEDAVLSDVRSIATAWTKSEGFERVDLQKVEEGEKNRLTFDLTAQHSQSGLPRISKVKLLVFYDDKEKLQTQEIVHIFDPRDTKTWEVVFAPSHKGQLVLTLVDIDNDCYLETPHNESARSFLRANYSRLQGASIRAHAWKGLLDTLRAGRLSLSELVEFLLHNIDHDDSQYLIDLIFSSVWGRAEDSKEKDADKLRKAIAIKARRIKARFAPTPILHQFRS